MPYQATRLDAYQLANTPLGILPRMSKPRLPISAFEKLRKEDIVDNSQYETKVNLVTGFPERESDARVLVVVFSRPPRMTNQPTNQPTYSLGLGTSDKPSGNNYWCDLHLLYGISLLEQDPMSIEIVSALAFHRVEVYRAKTLIEP